MCLRQSGQGGVFKKSKGAKLYVWVSDDSDHVPIKFSSRVIIGEFYALLHEHVKGAKDVTFPAMPKPPKK